MSIEKTFRALLAGNAGVTALVGNRIAQNSVPQGSALPLVVFTAEHDPVRNLAGTMLADECTLSVQCWAETAVGAEALADAVATAIATRSDVAAVTDRASAFDPDLGLDGVTLVVSLLE